MKRGQSALEFVVLVSFMLSVFFIFFVVIQGRIVSLTQQQDLLYLEEANNIVLNEVEVAFAAAPDFQHTFIIPSFGINDFEINITDNREVVAVYDTLEYVNFFPFNVTGHLNELNVNNTIYSTDGIVVFPDTSEVQLDRYAGISVNVNPESCYVADTLGACGDTSLLSAAMRPLCQMYYTLC